MYYQKTRGIILTLLYIVNKTLANNAENNYLTVSQLNTVFGYLDFLGFLDKDMLKLQCNAYRKD